jgi:hypothetical protein
MAKRPTTEDWQAARDRWEADPQETFESISEMMGVSRAAVSKKARNPADPWVRAKGLRELAEKAHQRADEREVTAKVTRSDPKVTRETSKKGAEDAAVDIRADVLERHRADWSQHRALFALQSISGDFDAGKTAKISAEMLTLRQRGERAAYGLDIEALPESAAGRELSDVERAARLASIVDAARRRREQQEPAGG